MTNDIAALRELEKKVLWLASWTIHHANHLRENADGLKVGGHQASSASLATIMTALYFAVLRPQDRVAVKPHASPNFHAIQYLLGKQTREQAGSLPRLQGRAELSVAHQGRRRRRFLHRLGRPRRGADAVLVADAGLRARAWLGPRAAGRPHGRAGRRRRARRRQYLRSDARRLEAGPAQLLVDHRLQPAEPRRRRARRAVGALRGAVQNFGWDVVILKYGSLQQAAFEEPGGEQLARGSTIARTSSIRRWCFQGGAAWRKRLHDDIGDQGASAADRRRSDDELARLMTNLGGHDLPSLLEAFRNVDHDRPTCFICYTIKGYGLPFAGHKDNHAGLMTPAQMETLRNAMSVRPGHEWDRFEGLSTAAGATASTFSIACRSPRPARRRCRRREIEVPAELRSRSRP